MARPRQFLRVPLDADEEAPREIFGSAGFFPVRGVLGAPVFTRFELAPGTIVYLGRIEATIRERRSEDELRARPLIPLIDQAVTGLSGGTFEIQISDNYDNDLVAFQGDISESGRSHDRASRSAALEPSIRRNDEVNGTALVRAVVEAGWG